MPAGKLCQPHALPVPMRTLQHPASRRLKVSSRPAKRSLRLGLQELNALRTSRPAPSPSRRPPTLPPPEGRRVAAGDGQEAHAARGSAARQRGRDVGRGVRQPPDGAFAKVMDLNVKAVFATIRDFAPLLQVRSRDDPSRVIITASVAGLGVGSLGEAGTYGYSASKAAVIHLGRNLALELGGRGITVNSIAPGFFPSKMSNGLLDMAGGPEVVGKGNPMGRLGRPEDIAGAVVYLASRAGSHVNGETIALDGARCGRGAS
ncbi:rhamnolipids biosynthesis 3-oxoacyl-reductase [Verticillium dahliae]|nr:rhamnolipids biosynthesis 3-oxoacyl-reductase [Verticillium dahliae]